MLTSHFTEPGLAVHAMAEVPPNESLSGGAPEHASSPIVEQHVASDSDSELSDPPEPSHAALTQHHTPESPKDTEKYEHESALSDPDDDIEMASEDGDFEIIESPMKPTVQVTRETPSSSDEDVHPRKRKVGIEYENDPELYGIRRSVSVPPRMCSCSNAASPAPARPRPDS